MRNIATTVAALACIGAMCSTVAAQQQETPGLTVEAARAMDANRDGRISQDEFLNESDDAALFAQLDTNADSLLDVDEIRSGIRVPVRTVR